MNAGDSKTEVFTYSVSDGEKTASTTLTLTINGTNDAPVAVDDFSSLQEGALTAKIHEASVFARKGLFGSVPISSSHCGSPP